MNFEGIYVPIVSPFKGDTVDLEGLHANIAFLNESPVDGYVALGTAGEFASLTEVEKSEVLCEVIENTEKPVIAGASYNNVYEALDFIEYTRDVGAKAALVAPPFYVRSNEEGLRAYFNQLADQSHLPLFLYNIPMLTNNHLKPELVSQLANHKNIIGIKDSGGSMRNFIEMSRLTPEDFNLFIGSEILFLPAMLFGASGAVLGAANLVPHLLHELYERLDIDLARRLIDVVEIMEQGVFPMGLKYAMSLRGLTGGDPRPPASPLSPVERARIEDLIRRLIPEQTLSIKEAASA